MTLEEERDLHYECMAASGVSEDESPFPKEQEYQKNMKNYQKDPPKPHPHAHWIKLWADGIPIEYKACGKWIKVTQFKTMINNTSMSDIEYRIKPKDPIDEPWMPKEGDEYYFLDVVEGDFCADCRIGGDKEIDYALYRNNNIFRTEEEAEAAIPRVISSLKGDSKKDINIPTNVYSPEIDCKQLSDGEISLIKALRNAGEIGEVFKFEKTLLVAKSDFGEMNVFDGHIAFITERGGARSMEIIDALKQIKAEQKGKQ